MLNRFQERWLLSRLARGHDLWPQFFDRYGYVLMAVLKSLEIRDSWIYEDFFQILATKLVGNNGKVIRDFLNNPQSVSFATFVGKVFRNLAIDHLRKMNREQKNTYTAEPLETVLLYRAHAGNGELANGDGDTAQLLIEAICDGDRDSTPYRILVLRFIEEHSVKDIASQLGLEPNNVSQYIRYYLQKARDNRDQLKEIVDAG